MKRIDFHFGIAWVVMCLALGLHVLDEALNDFLSVYNPTVESIKSRLPFIPLPTFSFAGWLTGLIVAVVILFLLSPFAFDKARWMIPLAYVFGFIMLANGLLHIAGSFYFGYFMPGVVSTPVLLASSIYLLLSIKQIREISTSNI
ncbi:Na+/H+ antiporter subunit E [candidate division KSB1 bacterium]|nr:Na+/H+ antiporter subunit E [candidate division KSB1 bacterium]NIR73242.1 Na+/H+ antiporter subunit E [candidate division KSB1 bacterium]NIS28356.1 Na+/H+ antiporter subunit E [candidate division KSB1 bacterium]NIT75000.1 Na+/H+ antiporter subunit E [candidate division KSB1 bacterium]NIU29089.1 Na+/H+ antiporter subunit E [candidate division KSB1 bacterium]